MSYVLACVAVGCWLAFGPGTSALGAPFLHMTVPVRRRDLPAARRARRRATLRSAEKEKEKAMKVTLTIQLEVDDRTGVALQARMRVDSPPMRVTVRDCGLAAETIGEGILVGIREEIPGGGM